jgi:hypothetical protein
MTNLPANKVFHSVLFGQISGGALVQAPVFDSAPTWSLSDPTFGTIKSQRNQAVFISTGKLGEVGLIVSGNVGGNPMSASITFNVVSTAIGIAPVTPSQVQTKWITKKKKVANNLITGIILY